jgi:coenzyme F420-0:L-glutamate ligase / coenzyme F420-1:gamma-L-glutamate ligase
VGNCGKIANAGSREIVKVDAIQVFAVRGMPEIRPGDALAELLLTALRRMRLPLRAGDIAVVKHKIVSKAEGRMVRLDTVAPSTRARRWAKRWRHDARIVELALRESKRVVRAGHGVLITETAHGFVCANSGLDLSNVDGGDTAVLLPADPDASARVLHRALRRSVRLHIPVIVADSFGRPWREGLSEVAIGAAGLRVLHDYRGQRDPFGYKLHATEEAVADELACMAGLACGKLERTPACIIRGFTYRRRKDSAQQLVRPAKMDLFR